MRDREQNGEKQMVRVKDKLKTIRVHPAEVGQKREYFYYLRRELERDKESPRKKVLLLMVRAENLQTGFRATQRRVAVIDDISEF